MPSTRTSAQSRRSIAQPGESLNVTPSRRTFVQRTNCTMRGRGCAGFPQNRPSHASFVVSKNFGPCPSIVPSPVMAMSVASQA